MTKTDKPPVFGKFLPIKTHFNAVLLVQGFYGAT